MEPLAYLYLTQEYESSEIQELVGQKCRAGSIVPCSKHLGKRAIGLFSAVSASWILGVANIALANSGVSTDPCWPEVCPPEESSPEFVPVILGSRYVKSYAGGSYYYILEDRDFSDRPALAVKESSHSVENSYHPVRPAPVSPQPLCGTFKLGDSGSGVACLQELLQNAGYFDGAITGYFGTITCDAVIAFQREHGLHADGIAGPETLDALNHIAGAG